MKFGSKIRDYDKNSFKQEIYLIVIVICEAQVGIEVDNINGSRRSLRKPRKLGMRVRQLALSCARSS